MRCRLAARPRLEQTGAGRIPPFADPSEVVDALDHGRNRIRPLSPASALRAPATT